MPPMVSRIRGPRRRAATTTIAVVVLAACVVASTALASPKAKPKTAAKAFCADSKGLAALDTKTAKDIASGVNITSPGYVSKQFGDTLALLHVMYQHSPTAILPTTKEYVNAYIAYGRQIAETHWNLQPTAPAEQKIVTDATLTYAPVATADLPKLDSFVKKTCGFGLNLITKPK
jgi:hypothetical protein